MHSSVYFCKCVRSQQSTVGKMIHLCRQIDTHI